ncbi:BMP-binding endothelial regulator protein-like, partial [Anneissia japonica]|uniref:BMP-binding endothelial regulator protein-like n=1 Tax=Anneissia japonica TaxID=1529436 RepID=UPI001425BB93
VCRVGFALQPDGTTCRDVSFCTYDGILHLATETWSDGKCSDCSCVDGRAECIERKCPVVECAMHEQLFHFPGTCCPSCLTEPARCTILPKGKLWTFDDHSFISNGDCRYSMATDYTTGHFSVEVEHNEYFTRRAIYLTLDCITVHIDFSGSVTISGVPVKLPYIHGNPKNVLVSRFGSSTITIVTNLGVKIIWKENGKVTIFVPKHYHGQMAGLCGDMNNNKMDDTMTRQMLPAKSTKELVHSWKVEGYTHCKKESKSINENIIINTANNKQFPACIGKHQHVIEYARSECQDILTSPLTDCHQYVDPQDYYSLCMQDSCVCGLNNPCYCESLTAYVLECQRQNVNLQNYNVKPSTCSVICEPSFVYDECGPAQECQPTCYDNKSTPTCWYMQCKPGCHCSAGRVLHQGRCIKKTDCPRI